MKYQYSCSDCSLDLKTDKKPLKKELAKGDDAGYLKTGEYVFVIICSMQDKPSNPICPRCGGRNTDTCFIGYTNYSWVRGDGIVKDKKGARRDMNKYTLMNNDPYGHMRQSGEVDHMINEITRAGMDMSKVTSRLAKSSQDAKKRSMKMKYDLTEDQIKLLIKTDKIGKATMKDYSEFEDVNAILSKLIPDFIIRTKKEEFVMMAAGKKLVEQLTEVDA